MGMFAPRDDCQVVFMEPKLCPNKCGAIVLARDFQGHLDCVCPLREELCHEGCGQLLLGKDIRSHAKVCIMTVLCERAEVAIRERALKELKSTVSSLYTEGLQHAAALHVSNGGKLAARGWPTQKLAERTAKIEAGMNQLLTRCKRKSKDRLLLALATAANTKGNEEDGPKSAMKQLDTLQDAAKFRGARPWDIFAPGLEELLDALDEASVCGGNTELRIQCEAATYGIMTRLLESALRTGDAATLEEVSHFCPDALKAIELSPLGDLPNLVAQVHQAIHQAALSEIQPNPSSVPEFFAAVKEGDLNLCTWLFEREQANPSTVDPKSSLTALMIATKSEDINMVQLLLQKRADADARCDIDGFTALHWAAQKRSARVMQVLLNGGANPRIKDKKGQDAMMKLVRRDFKVPAVGCSWSWVMHPQMRLGGPELEGSGVMELEDAKVAAEARPDCVGISFRSAGIGHQPHGRVYISLHAAASKSSSAAKIEEQKSPEEEMQQTATSLSPKQPRDCARMAYVTGSFRKGGQSKSQNNSSFLKGTRLANFQQQSLDFLQTQGEQEEKEENEKENQEEEIPSNFTSYLRVATDPAHDAIALLVAGADACAEDAGGFTSLHHHLLSAPSGGSLSIVSSLLRAQADVNARDRTARSTTPFLLAVSSKRTDLLKLMLTDAWPPAEVDARTCDGLCALSVAEEKGALEVVKLLKGAGAQVWSDADVNFGQGEHSSFFFDTRQPIGLDS